MADWGNLNFIRDLIFFPDFSGYLLLIKVGFILVSLVFLASIFILIFKSSWAKRFLFEDVTETFTARPYGAKRAFKEWLKIEDRLETEREKDYKLAVIEADNLLDESLKKMGYKGDTLSEKLKQIEPSALLDLDKILQAHKIRNNVVHDPDYKLSIDEAKSILGIYSKAFRDLEIF